MTDERSTLILISGGGCLTGLSAMTRDKTLHKVLYNAAASVANHDEAARRDTATERTRATCEDHQHNGSFVFSSLSWMGGDDLVGRPMLRTGKMLEFIPGMMLNQHSDSGRANQYFLRGLTLDPATDFAIEVDGMPVNTRNHRQGQGYDQLEVLGLAFMIGGAPNSVA